MKKQSHLDDQLPPHKNNLAMWHERVGDWNSPLITWRRMAELAAKEHDIRIIPVSKSYALQIIELGGWTTLRRVSREVYDYYTSIDKIK